MKMKCIRIVLLMLVSSIAFSQETVAFNYAAANIAADLKKDADAIYRLDEGILEITSPAKYTLKTHQITTVLNSDGAAHLQQSFRIDKFHKIEEAVITVYNSLGIEVQKYKKKDFMVQSYYDGISLATDDKVMRLSIAPAEYPCTIDVQYTTTASGYVDLPNWYINNNASAVEQFRYIVKVPAELDIRYRTTNIALQPDVQNNGKQKVYTWEAKNIAAQKIAAGGFETGKYLPQVEIAPNLFEYDGYKGAFANWSDFAKWNYALYEEKNPFSDQRITEIKALVSNLTDVNSKVKVLYDYLKNNMRYVSIQYGIGGFKPFTTRFVDEKKFGDCKALTNYMRNLLAVAGIKAYPALINAGYNKLPADPAFPKDVFNHVILCVPNGRDSIWLECTSNSSDAGFLGSFTENKNALLMTENGGVLVQTPKSNYNDNTLSTTTDIFLNEEGSASVSCKMTSSGSFYELLDEVMKMEEDRQMELFVEYLHIKQPDKMELLKEKDFSEKHQLELKLEYTSLMDFRAGSKSFFPTSVSKMVEEKLTAENNRRIEYIFRFPYKKSDTTIFHLPDQWNIENLPQPTELANEYVYYKREIHFDPSAHTIKIISSLMLKNNIIPPAQYKSVAELLNTIEKQEKDKLIVNTP